MVVLALLASLATAQVSRDTVRVSATLSNTRIVAGESTLLEIRVETNGSTAESIRIPSMPAGVEIISSQDFSQTQIDYPGGRTRIAGRNLVLTGRVTGRFTIPEVVVTVGRQTYTTRPVTFEVLSAPAGDAPPNTEDRVRLIAEAQPESVWVGQQVTLRVQAEFPRELRQRQTRPATYQAPNPAGFWAQDMTDPPVVMLRNVAGEIHETQTFRRAYFPLLPGRLVFPPARLSYEYRPSLGAAVRSRELSTDSIAIEVLALPDSGRPASFTGAVGRYSIEATLEPRLVAVGEAATLTVAVSGSGNVKALPAPMLPELDRLEVFPPTEEAVEETSSELMGGTKRFTWVVVPRDPGRMQVPAVTYGYFDPETASYRQVSTGALTLEVSGAPATRARSVDLRPIHDRPSGRRLAWVTTPAFATLQLVPLIILVAAIGITRRSAGNAGARAPSRSAERFVSLRQDALAADRGFWGRVAETARDALADAALDDSLRAAPVAAVVASIERAGVPRPTAAAVGELLDSLDRIRFAPGTVAPADAPAVLQRAEHLTGAATRALASAARRRRRAANGMIALLLPVPLLLAAEPAFERGVVAYRSAQYDDAAAAFMEYVNAWPGDAEGWYDAGNAWYLAGQRGQAIRAWIRAVRLDPRHADARRNIAQVDPRASAFVPPRFALSRHEAALGLSLLWWVAALVAAGRIRRRRSVGWPAIATAALAAIVLAAGVAGAMRGGAAAVSVASETVVRADPAFKAEEIEPLGAGAPVWVVERREGWVRVRTTSGLEGWVESSQIAAV